jgi:hypothetical protein
MADVSRWMRLPHTTLRLSDGDSTIAIGHLSITEGTR